MALDDLYKVGTRGRGQHPVLSSEVCRDLVGKAGNSAVCADQEPVRLYNVKGLHRGCNYRQKRRGVERKKRESSHPKDDCEIMWLK